MENTPRPFPEKLFVSHYVKRPLLTEQNIVDRAAARKWRNGYWTAAYYAKRRVEGIWISIFLLLFSLLGAVLLGILLVAKYGRP